MILQKKQIHTESVPAENVTHVYTPSLAFLFSIFILPNQLHNYVYFFFIYIYIYTTVQKS